MLSTLEFVREYLDTMRNNPSDTRKNPGLDSKSAIESPFMTSTRAAIETSSISSNLHNPQGQDIEKPNPRVTTVLSDVFSPM